MCNLLIHRCTVLARHENLLSNLKALRNVRDQINSGLKNAEEVLHQTAGEPRMRLDKQLRRLRLDGLRTARQPVGLSDYR